MHFLFLTYSIKILLLSNNNNLLRKNNNYYTLRTFQHINLLIINSLLMIVYLSSDIVTTFN